MATRRADFVSLKPNTQEGLPSAAAILGYRRNRVQTKRHAEIFKVDLSKWYTFHL